VTEGSCIPLELTFSCNFVNSITFCQLFTIGKISVSGESIDEKLDVAPIDDKMRESIVMVWVCVVEAKMCAIRKRDRIIVNGAKRARGRSNQTQIEGQKVFISSHLNEKMTLNYERKGFM